ncbi:MAG: RHS repeat protein, partial [Lysobacter sp.]|nr:RHS repeat protein [Lysobacter sp.]
MRHGLAALAALLIAAISPSALSQSVLIEHEYAKKVEAARSVAHLSSSSFGNQTSESTGQTVFSTFDVDLPGNNKLPVRFGRRLPIGIRYFDQELSGLGSWDVEVPYIEGTFSKLYGWSVAHANSPNRYKRCSQPSAPMVEGGAFTADDFFHGYNIHVPGVLDGSLLIDTIAYEDPTDGKTYPWILKSMDRVGCLPSLKNGHPGEGFVLLTKDGVRYHFDFMVERKASTLDKSGQGKCAGDVTCAALRLQRTRLFLLASRIEDRFGNHVDYQYDAQGRPLSITANDGRAITVQYGSNTVTVSAHGQVWLYTMQQGYLASVRNPDGSEWKYTPFGMPTQVSGVWNPGPGLLPSESFNPDDDCLAPRGTGNYWGSVNFEVTHPSGAKGDFEFWGHTFYRSHVMYTCNIVFTNVEGTSGHALVITPNYYDVTSLLKLTVSGSGISPEITGYDYGVEFYPYCNAIFSANGQPAGPACNAQGYVEDPCVGPYAECTDSIGRWVTTTRPDGSKVKKRFGVKYGVNEGLLLAEEVLDSTGAVVRRVDYQHLPEAVASQQAFGSVVGIPTYTSDPLAAMMRP